LYISLLLFVCLLVFCLLSLVSCLLSLISISFVFRNTFIVLFFVLTDPSGVGLRPLGCWGRGFEYRSGHGCLSLVFICCVVLCR
jgi:hypothetical protein